MRFDRAVDRSGNVVVAGHTVGALPGVARVGYDDAFVKKLDPAGKEMWTREFGTTMFSGASSVAIYPSGNIVVGGHVLGALPGQEKAALEDAFVRKYSPSGDEIWTAQYGSAGDDAATGVAIDKDGNIAIVGEARGALAGQNYVGTGDAYVLLFKQ